MPEPLKLADFPPAVRELYLKVAKEYAMLGGNTHGESEGADQEMPVCLIEALLIARTPITTDAFNPIVRISDEHH